jgi:hypothetical protein
VVRDPPASKPPKRNEKPISRDDRVPSVPRR